MEKSCLIFVKGTQVILTSRIDNKNPSSLQHVIEKWRENSVDRVGIRKVVKSCRVPLQLYDFQIN